MVYWVKKQVLGQGTYGTVSLAVIPFPNLHRPEIAVKTARRTKYIPSLRKEAQILEALRSCPAIVRYYDGDLGVVEEDGKKKITYHLLMEFAPGGSLRDLIDKNGGTLPESDVVRYTHMILYALWYTHWKGYVHCDIKPSNILVFPKERETDTDTDTEADDSPQEYYLKVADFGAAKRKDGLLSKAWRGTLLYSAPESVAVGYHEAPADIWALGCTMLEMITGKPPWSTIEDVRQLEYEIGLGKQLPAEIPQNLSEHGKDFLRKCLDRDHCSRWTADMLLRHPFLAECPSCAAVAYYPYEDRRWNSVQAMFEDYHLTVQLGMMRLRAEARQKVA